MAESTTWKGFTKTPFIVQVSFVDVAGESGSCRTCGVCKVVTSLGYCRECCFPALHVRNATNHEAFIVAWRERNVRALAVQEFFHLLFGDPINRKTE